MRLPRLAFAALVLAPASLAQSTWYVDASAPVAGDGSLAAPFGSIQAAVDAAAAGDTVSVAPGDYVEHVVIDLPLVVESQSGPAVTRVSSGGTGAAFSVQTFAGATLRGFTIFGSGIGVEDIEIAVVERCVITGNVSGVSSVGPILRHCTIVGNTIGIRESGSYGVAVEDSVVWGNADFDYVGHAAFALAVFRDCVGLTKVGGTSSISFTHVLHADPELWDGHFRPEPGSPCIDYAGPADAGAYEFDAAYGMAYADLGFALAGSAGAPALAAHGYTFAGETVTFEITGGLAGAPAFLVLGGSAAHLPLLGGTLVPSPDFVLPIGALDRAGALALSFAWPSGVPSGSTLVAQAWIVDAGAPQLVAATNGMSATAP